MKRQLETDGVPPPSDFELEAMDRPRRQLRLNFNAYTKYRTLVDRPINDQREEWHEWLGQMAGRHLYAWLWNDLWDQFIETQDAQDLDDTQQDALV